MGKCKAHARIGGEPGWRATDAMPKIAGTQNKYFEYFCASAPEPDANGSQENPLKLKNAVSCVRIRKSNASTLGSVQGASWQSLLFRPAKLLRNPRLVQRRLYAFARLPFQISECLREHATQPPTAPHTCHRMLRRLR